MSERISLDRDDLASILSGVRDYKKKHLDTVLAFPEKKPSQNDIDKVMQAAFDAGILCSGEETGYGIWESPEDKNSFELSLRILISLGQSSISIGFLINQIALGRYISKSAGIKSRDITIPVLQGNNGLARLSLAKYLLGKDITSQDSRLLHEYFISRNGTIRSNFCCFQADDSWQSLIIPVIDTKSNNLHFCYTDREYVDTCQITNNHGLDELSTWQIKHINMDKTQIAENISPDKAKSIFITSLGLNSYSVMCLGLGGIKHAFEKAKEYASQRKQGGSFIINHPAIQLFLGNILSISQTVENSILNISEPPWSAASVIDIYKIRAIVHPILCQAATESIQVFGGYGYMQDYGVEKILRDNNQLKLSFGTPTDIKLFIAAGEIE